MLLVHFPDNSNILNHRLKDFIPVKKSAIRFRFVR